MEINNDNFNEHFFDVRFNKPKQGQILAFYRAKACLVDGYEKKHLVKLLKTSIKVDAAIQIVRKVFLATEKEAVDLCLNICNDLKNGFSVDEVSAKEYDYTLEMAFYTMPENVPTNNHWSAVNLITIDEGKVINTADEQSDFEVKFKLLDEPE